MRIKEYILFIRNCLRRKFEFRDASRYFLKYSKRFHILQNVDLRGAPFEYLEGSYCDASFRSHQTNLGVVNSDIHSSGSTRLRGDKLEEALEDII